MYILHSVYRLFMSMKSFDKWNATNKTKVIICRSNDN